jgi:hypothetical protein
LVESTSRTRTELVREAILFWLDHCEGKHMSEHDAATLQVALKPVMKALEAMNERQCSLLVRVGMDVGTQLALISSRIKESERKEIMSAAKRYAAVRFREKLTNLEADMKKRLSRLFPQASDEAVK